MPSSFTITTTATDALKADAKGHTQAVFTVTNATARPVRGMAGVNSLGDTKREWLSIAGETERDFAAGTTQQFTVNFDAPVAAPPAGTSAAKYPFRLNVASAMNPDEDFAEGPTVTVEVAPARAEEEKPPPGRLWWIIPVAAVVLIGIGVVTWLLLRTRKVEVPNVMGKPVAEATSILSDGKLKANVTETRVTGTVSEGRVAEQSPNAGSGRVPEGSTVDLVVEAARPTPTPAPTQRINVALDKNAKQSSTVLNALASRAVDGNTSGNYFADNSVTHTDKTANAWWQVDLGAVHSIVQIKIWNRTDCCPERLSNFYVLVSSAPFASTDLNSTLSQPGVSGFPAPAQAGTPTTITVGKPGRYVRVQLVGTDWLSLAEVEVIADAPNVAWSSDGAKQQIVGGGFRFGVVQYVQRPGALLSIVPKRDSWVVLSEPKRAKSVLS
jgi:hypothetical protein